MSGSVNSYRRLGLKLYSAANLKSARSNSEHSARNNQSLRATKCGTQTKTVRGHHIGHSILCRGDRPLGAEATVRLPVERASLPEVWRKRVWCVCQSSGSLTETSWSSLHCKAGGKQISSGKSSHSLLWKLFLETELDGQEPGGVGPEVTLLLR